MSRAFQRHLIHSCTINRVISRDIDSVGGIAKTTAATTGVSCRYVEKSERLALPQGGYQTVKVIRLLLPNGTAIGTNDTVSAVTLEDGSIVQTKPAEPGGATTPAVFRVEEVLTRRTTKAHHISVRLEKAE